MFKFQQISKFFIKHTNQLFYIAVGINGALSQKSWLSQEHRKAQQENCIIDTQMKSLDRSQWAANHKTFQVKLQYSIMFIFMQRFSMFMALFAIFSQVNRVRDFLKIRGCRTLKTSVQCIVILKFKFHVSYFAADISVSLGTFLVLLHI